MDVEADDMYPLLKFAPITSYVEDTERSRSHIWINITGDADWSTKRTDTTLEREAVVVEGVSKGYVTYTNTDKKCERSRSDNNKNSAIDDSNDLRDRCIFNRTHDGDLTSDGTTYFQLLIESF